MRACPGCGATLNRGQYACRNDWFKLPADIRDAINATWEALDARNAQSFRDYKAAKRAGDQWFKEQKRLERGES